MKKYQNIAFLFPGQGAQYVSMAKDFYENYSEARSVFEEADDLLHRKLSTIILTGPEGTLTETRNSQTGIYVACLAILQTLKKLFPSLTPSVCAGLSLGEYTALTAAGKLNFSEGIQLVQKRGQYMNDACEATLGTMAVILGLEGPQVEQMVNNLHLPHDLWAANFNCPGQVVISGTAKGIAAGTEGAKALGAKRVLPLAVHGAFHSGLMQSAEERLADELRSVPLRETTVDLVMNVKGDYVRDLQEMRELLIQQITRSVRWEEGIRAMEAKGVDLFIEMGCGKTLAGFNKRIGTSASTVSIEKVTDLELLAGVV